MIGEPASPEAMEWMQPLPNIIKRHIEGVPVSRKLVEQFVPSLAAVVSLIIEQLQYGIRPFIKEFGDLFGFIASRGGIALVSSRRKARNLILSLQRFLAGDSLDE